MQLITADPRSLKDNPDRSRQSKSSPQSDALLCASIRAKAISQRLGGHRTLNSDHRPGFVECIATLGGIRGEVGQRRFMVPRSDYVIGRHGFVIVPDKHEPYDGPSSFLTWAARQ